MDILTENNYFAFMLAFIIAVTIVSLILDRDRLRDTLNYSYTWIEKKDVITISFKLLFTIGVAGLTFYLTYFLTNIANNEQLFNFLDNYTGPILPIFLIFLITVSSIGVIGLSVLKKLVLQSLMLINQIRALNKQGNNNVQVELNRALHRGNVEEINSVYFKITQGNLEAKHYEYGWVSVIKSLLTAGHLEEAEKLNRYLYNLDWKQFKNMPIPLYDINPSIIPTEIRYEYE